MTAQRASNWDVEIQGASRRFNIPPEWIRAVMQVESGGKARWKGGEPVVSTAGAMGLMQIMPDTFLELKDRYGLGDDPHDPKTNILAGAAYLRELYDLYGAPGFLAAYNAGPGRYREHIQDGRPLPLETRRYVEIIAPQIAGIDPGGEGPDRLARYAAAEVERRMSAPPSPAVPIIRESAPPAPAPDQIESIIVSMRDMSPSLRPSAGHVPRDPAPLDTDRAPQPQQSRTVHRLPDGLPAGWYRPVAASGSSFAIPARTGS